MKRLYTRGASSVIVLLVMFVALTVMLSLAGLASMSLKRSDNETKSMQAFQVAQAIVEHRANLTYQLAKKNKGYITGGYYDYDDFADEVTEGAIGRAEVVPLTDTTRAWVTSFATYGGKTRSLRMLINTKDVSIWNNAVFAGTGAAGQSINGNVDIRGSVHILGEGEPYSDLNGNGQWDAAEAFNDSNGNGVWDPGEPWNDANNDGVWNNAEPFNDTNWNGIYDPPLTTTDMSSDFGGTAKIGNNYYNMPPALRALIPAPPIKNGQESLYAELRVKHGRVAISGSATVGEASDPIPSAKGTLDGTFVNDGWAGNQGSSSVFSDNGANNAYDLASLDIQFPLLNGIGAQEYTDGDGTVWSNHKLYYDLNAMTIPVNTINGSTAAFAFADVKGNSISYTPAVKVGNVIVSPPTLNVNGVVKINGDLAINGLPELRYQGRGTMYATQDVYVGNNLLPKSGQTFPTTTVLGLVAGRNMNLSTGAGDAQISMAGAFYAQGTVKSAKQNQILGTFVASFFDMGKNVPNIYQVPSLKDNLPPAMPGAEPLVTIRILSWRDRRTGG
jgi:hypothetical protein